MTQVVRSDPPQASLAGFFALLGLVVLIGLFAALTIVGFLVDQPEGVVTTILGIPMGAQEVISIWMGVVFFLLAVLIDIYRRQYLPDEMIHKKRRPKIVYRRAIR